MVRIDQWSKSEIAQSSICPQLRFKSGPNCHWSDIQHIRHNLVSCLLTVYLNSGSSSDHSRGTGKSCQRNSVPTDGWPTYICPCQLFVHEIHNCHCFLLLLVLKSRESSLELVYSLYTVLYTFLRFPVPVVPIVRISRYLPDYIYLAEEICQVWS